MFSCYLQGRRHISICSYVRLNANGATEFSMFVDVAGEARHIAAKSVVLQEHGNHIEKPKKNIAKLKKDIKPIEKPNNDGGCEKKNRG
jgi:hypothetical protein